MTRSLHPEDTGAVSLRLAGPADARAPARLAALYRHGPPSGDPLLAKLDGVPAAAPLHTESGEAAVER